MPRLPLTTNFTFPQVGDPAAVGPLIFNALAGIVGTDRLAVQGVTYAANILGFLLGGDPNGGKVMAANAATVCFHYRCDGVKEETGGYPREKKGEKKKLDRRLHNIFNAIQAASKCPNTKIVLSGYSQGAQVVHRAAGLLSADVASKVSAGEFGLLKPNNPPCGLAGNKKANLNSFLSILAVLTLGDPFQKRTLANIPASKWKVICHDGDSICTGGIIPNDPHKNYQIDAQTAAAWIASMVA